MATESLVLTGSLGIASLLSSWRSFQKLCDYLHVFVLILKIHSHFWIELYVNGEKWERRNTDTRLSQGASGGW